MLGKTNSSEKVLELFFTYPTRRFHTREIARLTKVSPPVVSSAVRKLEKAGFLSSRKTRAMNEVTANTESREFVLEKRLFNIRSLFRSGLMAELEKADPEAIVVFGSYSRGEDTEKSDIDIAVIGGSGTGSLSRFEDRLKRNISVHKVAVKKVSGEFLNSLANGIVLEGYLEAV